ncbi:uncharacterized protein [Narcine bancroftii]|uniref:uncharacterized protein isoform X6 n=1 Tax=Narcine bancroftii TaxID=1343680 RepID=UPI0038311232
MTAFITHPSVRVKGTEHNYSPVLCQDEDCSASSKGSHMHCPFCNVTEAYQDPVILRAHYRVKHVDKGLNFAGLKILRCCNHCDIIGTIKGEKKFRGAHWHCYRCRNGFNRRDEAVKHYKTHFRNPHTTFQIQVTQDSKLANGISPAEDTLGSMSTKGHQTLVLMDPDGENGELVYNDNSNLITDQNGDALDQNLLIEKQMLELHQQNQQLRIEKAENEHRLQVEVQQLKNQIAGLMEVNWQMAEELKQYKYSEDIKNKINQMIEHMEMQHKELLHLQLELLQKEYRKLRHQANESPVSSQDSAKDCTNRTAKQALVGTSTFRPRCHSISLTIPSSVVTEQEIRTSEHEIMSSSLDEIGGTEVDLSSRNVISFIEASDNSSNGSADLTTLEIVEVKLDSESPISTIESPSPTHVHLYPVTQVNDHMELSASKRVSEDDSVGECQPKIQRTN